MLNFKKILFYLYRAKEMQLGGGTPKVPSPSEQMGPCQGREPLSEAETWRKCGSRFPWPAPQSLTHPPS